MQTRVPKTKSGRKKQPPEPKLPQLTAEELIALGNKMADKMKLVHASNQLVAQAAQVSARRRLILAADALLPKAAQLAEKGKPRLLAVLTKIINDRNIKFGQK
jgi:hypothetical protein